MGRRAAVWIGLLERSCGCCRLRSLKRRKKLDIHHVYTYDTVFVEFTSKSYFRYYCSPQLRKLNHTHFSVLVSVNHFCHISNNQRLNNCWCLHNIVVFVTLHSALIFDLMRFQLSKYPNLNAQRNQNFFFGSKQILSQQLNNNNNNNNNQQVEQ